MHKTGSSFLLKRKAYEKKVGHIQVNGEILMLIVFNYTASQIQNFID